MKLETGIIKDLESKAYQIRRLSLEMICYGQWGHLGGSFSMAEILAVLYFHTMNIRSDNPTWEGRDRLILSKAHGSPALYAALALRGYFPLEKLYTVPLYASCQTTWITPSLSINIAGLGNSNIYTNGGKTGGAKPKFVIRGSWKCRA